MDLQIIKIASANKNQKILKKYTHEVKNKNSICGDEITIKLLISSKIIKDITENDIPRKQGDMKITSSNTEKFLK